MIYMKDMRFFIISCLIILFTGITFAGHRPGALTLTLGGGYDFFSIKRHLNHADVSLIELGTT